MLPNPPARKRPVISLTTHFRGCYALALGTGRRLQLERTRESSTMRLRLALGTGLALATIGCGPIQSTSLIMDADTQLEAARAADAPKYAPYEYTLADAYLHKAREEAGYADYEVSIDFAQKALDNAKKAKELSVNTVKEQGVGTPSAPAPVTPSAP
jgi:hypothetical protein